MVIKKNKDKNNLLNPLQAKLWNKLYWYLQDNDLCEAGENAIWEIVYWVVWKIQIIQTL